MTRHLVVKILWCPHHFNARGNDRQPKVPEETDRTEFSTRLGQARSSLHSAGAVQSQAMTHFISS